MAKIPSVPMSISEDVAAVPAVPAVPAQSTEERRRWILGMILERHHGSSIATEELMKEAREIDAFLRGEDGAAA